MFCTGLLAASLHCFICFVYPQWFHCSRCVCVRLQWLTPEGFRSLIALVGTNGQGVGTSAISVWVRNCTNLDLPPEEQDKLDQIINQLYDDLEKGKYAEVVHA